MHAQKNVWGGAPTSIGTMRHLLHASLGMHFRIAVTRVTYPHQLVCVSGCQGLTQEPGEQLARTISTQSRNDADFTSRHRARSSSLITAASFFHKAASELAQAFDKANKFVWPRSQGRPSLDAHRVREPAQVFDVRTLHLARPVTNPHKVCAEVVPWTLHILVAFAVLRCTWRCGSSCSYCCCWWWWWRPCAQHIARHRLLEREFKSLVGAKNDSMVEVRRTCGRLGLARSGTGIHGPA